MNAPRFGHRAGAYRGDHDREREEPRDTSADVVLGHWPRGEDEALRLRRCTFKGRAYYDARLFYKAADGEWAPTRKGTSIRASELAEFVQLLEAELDAARVPT